MREIRNRQWYKGSRFVGGFDNSEEGLKAGFHFGFVNFSTDIKAHEAFVVVR